jgi:hypothetical protein
MSIDLNQFKLGEKDKARQINIPVYEETANKVSKMREYNISVNRAVDSLINTELYPAFEKALAEGIIKQKAKQ